MKAIFKSWRERLCNYAIDKALAWHPDTKGNLVSYAETELRLAGLYDDGADYGKGNLANAVMRLVKINCLEGHSGLSHRIAMSLFERVANYRPLTPLTGNDDEWMETFVDATSLQNKRYSSIFKEIKTGKTYRIDAKAFKHQNGGTYTSRESFGPVSFPWSWTPTKIVKAKP
jgi:hypothetical protein